MPQKKALILFAFIFFICACSSKVEKSTDIDKEPIVIAQLKDSLIPICNDSVKNEAQTYEESYNKALTLWQIPLEESDVETSFGKAHVIACGPANAEVLVLLHGMNASSTMWYPNIKALSEHYRVYAIDFLLEPGKSDYRGEVNKTSEVVKWYYEIFNQLKLKKFSLIGASRGGWLAINIALHSRSSINKIVLLSPAQTFIWIRPGSDILFNISYSFFPKRKKLRSVLETMTFDVDKISQVYINQYYLATKKASINKCFLEMTPFSVKELKSLKMPVLLMIGDQDIINSEKSLDIAKRSFSDLKLFTIKNAGHFLSVDQPEVVNEKILDFLKRKNK